MSVGGGDSTYSSDFSQLPVASKQKGINYNIQGVTVDFPYNAYPSQINMMDKIIISLRNKQNCLLESPTGSGKSAALLCAALAWQRKELDAIRAGVLAADEAGMVSNENERKTAGQTTSRNKQEIEDLPCTTPIFPRTSNTVSGPNCQNFNEDDDFQPHKRFRLSPVDSNPATCHSSSTKSVCELPSSMAQTNVISEIVVPNLSVVQSATVANAPVSQASQSTQVPRVHPPCHPRIKKPKIFFCTRTHKQVKQLTEVLDSTSYRDTKMCILSSRERTCIHPEVSKLLHKDEGCKDLLKNPEGVLCSFYTKSRGMSQRVVKNLGLDTAWDLEDFVSHGKKLHFCPYFGLREIMHDADIIFSPYNYLIDPQIRSGMNISLKGNVVILDEGHNIEDSARAAASFSVNQKDLDKAIKDLEHTGAEENNFFAAILSKMSTWISRNSKEIKGYSEFSRSGKVRAGKELVAIMTEFGAGPDKLPLVHKLFSSLSKCDKSKRVTVTSSTLFIIEGLLLTLSFLYRDELKFMSDYKCVIVKTIVLHPHNDSGSGWRHKTPKASFTYTLNLWCLNPGVCFSDFHNIHSLIVTSGTLSPMVSFESELALSFPIAFEANHVIKKSQVWVGSIGCGPTNVPLKAVYENTQSLQFQDELGEVVWQVCKTVPNGVLCFFPSYSNLDKMVSRWRLTGLMEKLSNTKLVVEEPRANNEAHFEDILQDFYGAVDEGEGALFLAVYRGKVSEGLNFSDDKARAVIAVGIPYPNVKDIQVDLKQKYNNEHWRKRSLMSGRDWYEAQAFRALNQALGRCIRHIEDWGALILVDQRFQTNWKCVKSLSKWVRNELCHYGSFSEAIDSLKYFTRNAQPLNSISTGSQRVPLRQLSCSESI